MVKRLFGALALCFLCLGLPRTGQARTGQAQLPAALTWQNAYGTSRNETGGLSVAVPGGYLLAGQQSFFNGTAALLYFVRTNLQGDTLWTKTLPGPGGSILPRVTGLVRDAAGNLLLTGESTTANSGIGFVLKLTATCVPIWDRIRQPTTPGAVGNFATYSLPTVDSDGNYVLVEGAASTFNPPQAPNRENTVLKLNQATGAELWATALNGTYATTFATGTGFIRGLVVRSGGYTLFASGNIEIVGPNYQLGIS